MLEIIKNKNFNSIKNIDYGFFTRKGGFSAGEFESLNTNSSEVNGEPIGNVKKNLAVIQKYFNTPNEVFKLKQIHSNDIFILEDDGVEFKNHTIEADAIVTRLRNVAIGVSTADCVPILLVDEENSVIAALHAGWRGLLDGIIENTVDGMEKIGAERSKIKALAGPHLRVDNFEVKNDFVEIIKSKNNNYREFIVEKNSKIFFDTSKYIKSIIDSLGIEFWDVGEDTYTQPDLFFSYRRSCHLADTLHNRPPTGCPLKFGCQFSSIMLK